MLLDLKNIFGDEDVATDVFTRTLYGFDPAPIPELILSFFNTVPDAVVRPENTKEVLDAVKYVRKNKMSLIPRGSATSGFGGAIPTRGGIVLDMMKMNKVLDIDDKNLTVTVQPGLTYSKLLGELERRGFTLFTYPSSAPVSTIGGWISTGGYGIGSLKYGHLIDQIVEIEAVLANGKIVQLKKGSDHEQGYAQDWLIGSEGTLGVITKATLRIKPMPENFIPHSVCFTTFDSLNEAMLELARSKAVPFYIEYFDEEYLDIKRSLGYFAPEAGAYAVLCFEGSKEEVEEGSESLRTIMRRTGGEESEFKIAEEEWKNRFYPLRIGRAGPTLFPEDILIPLKVLSNTVEEIWKMKSTYRIKLGIYGSVIARDRTTLMPLGVADERKRLQYLSILPLARDITELSIRKGGRPYGIGLWNSFHLKKSFDESVVKELMLRKKTIDVDNIMNPGKFFHAQTRFGFQLHPSLYHFFMCFLKLLRYIVK